MTDKTKPRTTVAQDVEALRAVMDGQHAQTETPAEVLADMSKVAKSLRLGRHDFSSVELDVFVARLSRSLAAGKVAVWMREGATTVMHNFRFDKPDAGPWVPLYYTAPPADPAKASEPEAIRVAVDELCWIANSDPCASQGDTVMEIRGRAKQALQRIEAMAAKASGSAPDGFLRDFSPTETSAFCPLLPGESVPDGCVPVYLQRTATPPASAPEVSAPVKCERQQCGCSEPSFTDAFGALRFLSGRMKHAGIAAGVAQSYARDIDAILSASAPEVTEDIAWKVLVEYYGHAIAKDDEDVERMRGIISAALQEPRQ